MCESGNVHETEIRPDVGDYRFVNAMRESSRDFHRHNDNVRLRYSPAHTQLPIHMKTAKRNDDNSRVATTSAYYFDPERDTQRNCTGAIACAECIATTPIVRGPSVLWGRFCLGCFGVGEDAQLSVDAMRGNDGTPRSCVREIANRWAGRYLTAGREAREDWCALCSYMFGWIVVVAVVAVALLGLHSMVALGMYVVGGCDIVPSVNNNTTPTPEHQQPPPFHAYIVVDGSLSEDVLRPGQASSGGSRIGKDGGIVGEESGHRNLAERLLSESCPAVARIFSYRLLRHTLFSPMVFTFGLLVVGKLGLLLLDWCIDARSSSGRLADKTDKT